MFTFKLPVNCEPLAIDLTTNPLLSLTDAVTEPDAILAASPVKLENGILVNPAPEPENIEPSSNTTLPPVTNKLPVNVVLPTNIAGPMFLNVLLPLTVKEPVIVTSLLK